ncbi:putative membrane-associated eicosanoid glutathione metabolism protein [Neofusicoccum parvum UCRNP2]|uniref:Putative membrane-associated eicosanoid glutathione metabolism protein n=1 Tax=Botryosphaeria parva (strain UCR-NP2) TaxID=1287680 RepID=R1GQL6_BOTPV|nr:putative membrane-associated eicosanoid glutathione metabolism protein [Neofusicoccum parvum UCRNP2]
MVTVGLGLPVPNLAPITATWTAPFAVYLVFLSNRIAYQRIKNDTYMGDRAKPIASTTAPEDDPLFVSTRCHANFLENVPLALLFSAVAELNGGSRRALHYALASFFVLRVAHAELGLRRSFRGIKSLGLGRITGFYGSQGFLVGLAGYSAWLVRGGVAIAECRSPAIASIPLASALPAMSNVPTLINLPPPPSDPVTPSDAPGTPNSATTSMSELSTVAIKDGHRGHLPHHHQNPLDAERADRISRLAGLERVAATGGRPSNLNPSSAAYGHNPTGSSGSIPPTQGYFDANNQPQIVRERSTVGSASATGSVGGRTTWASGSDVGYDPSIADRMSEDQEMETSSMGGFSDEGAASLVGFGEGARTPARAQSGGIGSPVVGKASAAATSAPGSAVPGYMRGEAPPSPMTGVSAGSGASTPSTEAQVRDAQRIDGITYDAGVTDTTARAPPPLGDHSASQQAGAATAADWMERQAEREQADRQ